MLAVISTAWVVPGLVGPGLAGIITEHAGWRWVFLGLAPLPPIAASLAWPAMRRLGQGNAAPRNWRLIRSAIQLAAGTGLLITGLGRDTILLTAVFVVVGCVLAIPALMQLLPPGTLWAAPGLPAAIATNGLLSLAFFGVDAFIPLALTNVRGLSITTAGLALTAATMTWTAGAWLQAHYAARRGRRQLTLLGVLIAIIGIALAATVLFPVIPTFVAPLAWGIAGLGVGLAFSTLSLAVLETATPGQEGTASAALQLASVLGGAIGTGVGGAIIAHLSAHAPNPRQAILIQDLIMLGVMAVTALAATRLPRDVPPTATKSAA